MRRLVLLLPLACTAQVDPPAREPAPAPPPLAAAPARPAAPTLATCPIDQPRAQLLDLDAVSDVGRVAGKTWHVATAAGAPVLLHLDPAGALARTPLDAWTEEIAGEGDARLRLFFTATARWSAVDLRDPDAPAPGRDAAIPGLVPGEYPKAVASDGACALVSLYRENPRPGGERYVGDTFLLDVATGEPQGPRADMTVWTADCAAGNCYGVATVNTAPQTRALVVLDHTGARRLDALGQWGCGGLATWRDGQRWQIAWSDRGMIGLASVDLTTGAHVLGSIETAPETCVELRHLALSDRHGLLAKDADRLRFIPIGAPVSSGPPELLPVLAHDQHRLLAAGDGVLLVDYDATSGLQKDRNPAPDGSREYDAVWRFAGRHRYVRPRPGEWEADPAVPLPHDGEDGRNGRGYRVHLLARPGHAGVLLAGDGLPSEYLPLRRPCP